MPTHHVILTDEQEAFVTQQVTSGRFKSVSEVLREGLRLMALGQAEAISRRDRSHDGAPKKITSRPPRTKNLLAESMAQEQEVKNGLRLVFEKVKAYCDEHEPGQFEIVCEEVKECLQAYGTSEEVDLQNRGKAYTKRGQDHHLIAPSVALAHYFDGMRAIHQNRLDQAIKCLKSANFWVSEDSGMMYSPALEKSLKSKARENAGKKGGERKQINKFDPVQDLVAKILDEITPKKGWKSLLAASISVAEQLKIHHATFLWNSGMTSNDPQPTIYKWFRDPERFQIRLVKK